MCLCILQNMFGRYHCIESICCLINLEKSFEKFNFVLHIKERKGMNDVQVLKSSDSERRHTSSWRQQIAITSMHITVDDVIFVTAQILYS